MTLADVPAGLLLTPGASADRDHSTLVAIEKGLPELDVRRLTLGTTSIARAVEKIREAADGLAGELGVDPSRIVLGGRSFGGRACSVAVADGQAAAALVLLSYPLHPPGKPEKLRVEHFGRIDVPVLAISGRRDPFGSPAELEEHLALVTGPVTLNHVDGAHSPKADDKVIAFIRYFLGKLVRNGSRFERNLRDFDGDA